jgi:hypothetical protein
MYDGLSQFWEEIIARPNGPMAVRFYLQPLMATIFAVRDGIRDSRQGRPPYLWALITNRESRTELLRDGWKSVGKVFIVATVFDWIYQLIVLHGIQPLQALSVAAVLALVPYVVFRGPVNRVASRRRPPTEDVTLRKRA